MVLRSAAYACGSGLAAARKKSRGIRGLRSSDCGTRSLEKLPVFSFQWSVVANAFSGDPQGSAGDLRIVDFRFRSRGRAPLTFRNS